jgi:hypothetical protein
VNLVTFFLGLGVSVLSVLSVLFVAVDMADASDFVEVADVFLDFFFFLSLDLGLD